MDKERLRSMLVRYDWTLNDTARLFGMTPRNISFLLAGKNAARPTHTLLDLADDNPEVIPMLERLARKKGRID